MVDIGLWAVALATAPVLVTVIGSVLTKRAELQAADRMWRRETALESYSQLLRAASLLVSSLKQLDGSPYIRVTGRAKEQADASSAAKFFAAMQDFEDTARTIELFCGEGLRECIEELRSNVLLAATILPPKEDSHCTSCGAEAQEGRVHCQVCGAQMLYGEGQDLKHIDTMLSRVSVEARRDLFVTRR